MMRHGPAHRPPTNLWHWQVLVRLAHQYGINEDADLSQPATVDLAKLFDPASSFTVKAVAEMSLTANQAKEDIMRKREAAMRWYDDGTQPRHEWRRPASSAGGGGGGGTGTAVALGPLEIKTFLLTVK